MGQYGHGTRATRGFRDHARPRTPPHRVSGLANGRPRAPLPPRRSARPGRRSHAGAPRLRRRDVPRSVPDRPGSRRGVHGGGRVALRDAHRLHHRRLQGGRGADVHVPGAPGRGDRGNLRQGAHRGHRGDGDSGRAREGGDRAHDQRIREKAARRGGTRRRRGRLPGHHAHGRRAAWGSSRSSF